MDAIKVKKNDLLDKLRQNRAAHQGVFEKALVGYRKLCIEHLEQMLADAKSGRRIRRQIELVEPMNQTKDYDRVVAMLEMSQDETIELSERDFACYVLDNWSWKEQFTSSTLSYAGA